jgi:hypothetical protein
MRVVVDRIEKQTAVLELPDGGSAVCDKALLPAGTREGDVLDWSVTLLSDERRQREQEVKDLQDRLKKKNS